ncbi:hypothetical protein JCM1841_005151 [Sporobolomyces salmonicolor]
MASSLEPIEEEGETLHARYSPPERAHAPSADDSSVPLTLALTTHGSPPAPQQASYYPTDTHCDIDDAAASCSVSSASLGREAFNEAKALYEAGLSISSVNPLAAILHFRQAASVFSEVRGQSHRVKKCLWQAGMCCAKVGLAAKKQKAPEDAKAAFEEAITLFSSIGEAAKTAMAHYQIGLVSIDLLTAADHIKKAALLYAELGDEPREAMCYAELGSSSLFGRHDPDTGIYYFKQALLLYIKLGDAAKEARALYAIADLASRIDKQTAYNYYLQARVIFHRRDDKGSCANCSYQLGKICTGNKAFEPAVHYFEEASSLFHDIEKAVDEAWSLYRLALVMLKAETGDLALDYLTEARKLFAEAHNERAAEGSCLMRMGEILAESNPPLAKALLEEALEYVDPVKERVGRRSTMWLRKLEGGRAGHSAGDMTRKSPEEAVAWWAVGA